jgi:hypothetical protein
MAPCLRTDDSTLTSDWTPKSSRLLGNDGLGQLTQPRTSPLRFLLMKSDLPTGGARFGC